MAAEIALKIAPVLEDRLRNNEPIHGADELCASDDDEDSEDEKKHEKLLKEIRSLSSSGKKRVASQRSEPHKQVSEFHLSSVQDGTQQVDLNDLIGSLNNTNEYGSLKKKLDSMQRNSNTLDVPLPKPEVQKIQRTIAYGETKKDIEKWAPTVKKNREAEHLSFPLKPYRPPVLSLSGLAVKFKPRTPLEEEVAAVLRGSSHVLERRNKELTEEEEKALLGMDLEEAKERRHELQKLRALQSYYEAKCRRMKKIKSKKYHRVKRKAEKRAAEKRVEEDPQAEDDKDALEKVEKLRAEERMSLKHRNTSKWAKHLITKAGKNADAKKLLQEQLRISRNLTQKAAESESDEEMEAPTQEPGLEDNEEESDSYGNLVTSEDNPWKLDTSGAGFHSLETSNNVDDDSSIKLHRLQPIRTQEADNEDEEDSEQLDVHERETEEEFELQPVSVTQRSTKKTKKQHFEEAKIRKKRKPKDSGDEVTVKKKKQSDKSKRNSKHILNEAKKSRSKTQHEIKMVNISEDTKDDGTGSTGQRNSFRNGKRAGNDASAETVNSKSKEIRVDPTKIFRIEDQGNVGKDIESDSLRQKRIDIQQAFANDDVVEEFIQEKKEIEEASTPKDVDLSLPGWGSWAGTGIKPSVKKKEKFIKKADPAPPRKDKNLAHVIINEEKSQLFSRNQVSSVPHPYGNHVQFERSVRNPVGKHWNTSTTFHQLTKPRVSTLIGTIIEPMRATKEIKRSHPEDRKNKKLKGTSGIAMHS